MKKVVFLTLKFTNVKSTGLYSVLMSEFVQKGHEVLIISATEGKKNSEVIIHNGLKILRVPTLKLFGKSKIIKGLANLLLPIQYKKALKKHKIPLDFDLILMPTPPITLIDLGLWIKKKSNGKLYLILRDIFPQNAVDLGMMNPNGFIHSYFRKKEIKLYKESDSIGCMSPANVDYIKKHNPYLNYSKLHLLPNWENLNTNGDKYNAEIVRDKYNLKNKIVVIFGGNIGLPQKMENIINLADNCQELEDLVFFIIGKGTERKKIAQMVHSLKLKNVILKDALPRDEYNRVLSMADIGLVSLNEKFTIPNFPSKVNAYYNFKKPVLASLDLNTDFGKIQEEINCGYWSEAGNVKALKENLLKLYSSKDLRSKLGQNGYDYLAKELITSKAYEKIMNKI